MNLEDWGFRPAFRFEFDTCVAQLGQPDLIPGRVIAQYQHLYRVGCAGGERLAETSGRFRHTARAAVDYPVTGDFVVLAPRDDARGVIHAVLPRRSQFVRSAAGRTSQAQVVAANVDSVFLVCGLDGDFNPRRIERALVLAWDSGARPVVVLTKTDACDDVASRVRMIEALAPAVPIHAVCAPHGTGLEALSVYLAAGETVALLGSSGAGKSTLANRLLGRDLLATQPVRDGDDRGRHTTSHRELVRLPGGALLIDTPGMRELQLTVADSGLGAAFDDVAALAAGCGFADCTHHAEPRCAVMAAAHSGALDAARLESYRKLQRELAWANTRHDESAGRLEKQRWKAIHKAARQYRPRG